jgi:large subunit ribosomal protein L15
MELHQLKATHKRKSKKRVARGGKRGTYSGKGVKGQKSRSGRKMQPIIRELIKRYPKKRGYKQNPKKREAVLEINLEVLEKKFKSGDKVNPKLLLQKGIIGKIKRKMPKVKILGKGELKKKLIVEDCEVSEGARKKIENSKGVIKL